MPKKPMKSYNWCENKSRIRLFVELEDQCILSRAAIVGSIGIFDFQLVSNEFQSRTAKRLPSI
jgi:hypothetical protein